MDPDQAGRTLIIGKGGEALEAPQGPWKPLLHSIGNTSVSVTPLLHELRMGTGSARGSCLEIEPGSSPCSENVVTSPAAGWHAELWSPVLSFISE